MTAALASIGPIGWVAAVAGSLFLYLGLAIGVGRLCAMSDPGEDDERVNWIPVLPPVPPSQPVVDLDDWLDGIPAEVLARAEMNRRFYDIVDAETRWFADGAA